MRQSDFSRSCWLCRAELSCAEAPCWSPLNATQLRRQMPLLFLDIDDDDARAEIRHDYYLSSLLRRPPGSMMAMRLLIFSFLSDASR